MPLVDTHCHLNFERYDEDRAAVLARAASVGVSRVILPAVDTDTSEEIVNMIAQIPGLYGAVGIHPNSTSDFNESMIETLAALAAQPGIVAVGEIGLDYYWDSSPKPVQQLAFESQLALAARLELPVIIHNRDASEDTLTILERWAQTLPESLRDRAGVLHSFSAPLAIAERALAAGFYLGFTGPLTYKNADELRHVAARVPLNRLLLETDGPYLTPMPHRSKRNEPSYVPLIAERMAGLHLTTVEAIAEATTANAERLFRLPATTISV